MSVFTSSTAGQAYECDTAETVRLRIALVATVYALAMAVANTFEWTAYPDRRPLVATTYLVELTASAITLIALHRVRFRRFARGIGAAMVSVLVMSIAVHVLGSGGPITRIASSFLCLLTGLVVLVPWGWRAQGVVAATALLTIVSAIVAIDPAPDVEDQIHCVLVLVAMGSVSTLGAHFLDRYRREAFVRTAEVAASEGRQRANAALLDIVRRHQSRFIAAGDSSVLFGEVLEDVLALTHSRYGFVAEVLTRPTGAAYVRTLAISDIAWNEATRQLYGDQAPHIEFDNLETLFGAVITTGDAVIANTPAIDPRRGGLPPGHPALDAFLGLPLRHGPELVGMIGIANRPGGYDAAIIDYLQPLTATSGSLIAACRNVQQRQQAESALWGEARMTSALADASRVLMSTLEPGEVLSHLCHQAIDLLEADLGLVMAAPPDGESAGAITFHGATESEEQFGRTIVVPLADLRALFDTGSDCQIADVGDLPDHVRLGHGLGRTHPQILCLALRQHGEVVGMQVVVRRDPTAAFTPAQRRIAESLAHVASMALTNALLLQDLQRANKTKSEFVSTMSHELRTPLNVILGYAEMARDIGIDHADRGLCLERIESAGRDLLSLIEDTLEIGRIETRRDDVELSSIPTFEFWERLGNQCQHLPHGDDVRLVWEPAPVTTAVSDPRKLTVIVRNLVGNALKFTASGEVRASLALVDDDLRLTVSDTGIGIRPEDQQTIFEMFRQIDGSDRRRFGGTGLGLYIVQRYAEQLGGTVVVDSALGEGATFRVTVPAGLVGSVRAA